MHDLHMGEHGWGRGRGRGPGGGGGRGAGRRGRARRGDVRAAVLALLTESPMHGYEMIQQLDERTGGLWKPSPGSIYPALSLLEDEGLVQAEEVDGRRRFTLTEAGRRAAEDGGGRTPWDDVTAGVSAADHELRRVLRQIGVAARQVGEAGDDAAKTRAAEILVETRKRLYAILAETD